MPGNPTSIDIDATVRGSADTEPDPFAQLESSAEDADLNYQPVGSKLNGRYRIDGVLGKGGMGVVYRVTDDLDPQRKLALKSVYGLAGRPGRIELFEAEFTAMAAFRHPNVAQVYDFEALEGTDGHLFTMEYVDGPNILHATEGTRWPIILDMTVQICRALAYVHSRHVLHRDLKPGNVLVDGEGTVKVLDFGLAGAHAGARMGTPMFMAPEQRFGQSVDHRVDLYSLGVTLYYLLCRKPPFDTHSLLIMEASQQARPVEFGPAVRDLAPPWLLSVVRRLCAPRAADRYRSAGAVIEAINRAGGLNYPVETAETSEGYILSSRFVGRDASLAQLVETVRGRTAGESLGPPFVLVSGDAGVGRTRLLREVRYVSQLGGTPFIEAPCFAGSLQELGPVVQLVEHAIVLAEVRDAEDLLEAYGPYLARLCPSWGRERGIEPAEEFQDAEADRLRQLDQLCSFLIELTGRQPLIVHLADLHHVRAGTVALLDYLLRAIAAREEAGHTVHLILLGDCRDGETAGRPVAPLLETLHQRGQVLPVPLAPLSDADIGDQVCSMLGIGELPGPFLERLAKEAAGNPYYAEELMQALVDDGAVYLEEGRWTTAREIGEVVFPHSILDALRQRVSVLGGAERRLLELLALGTRSLSMEVLLHASGLDAATTVAALGVLERKRLVRRSGADGQPMAIEHTGLRETVAGALAAPERARTHLGLARATEAIHQGDLEEHRVALAHHFDQAGDRAKALEYSLAAGEQARKQYANELAVELLGRAVAILQETDPGSARLLPLQESIAGCLALQGELRRGRDHYQRVFQRTEGAIDRARLARKIGEVLLQNDELREGAEQLWYAVELLGGSRPGGPRRYQLATVVHLAAHLLRQFVRPTGTRVGGEPDERRRELGAAYLRLAYVYYFHEPGQMLLPLFRAVALLERQPLTAELCHATATLCHLYAVVQRFVASEKYGDRALEMAVELDSPWHSAVARARLGISRYLASQWVAALEEMEAARDGFRRCGDMFELGGCYTHIFAALVNLGRLEQAAEQAADHQEFLERTGDKKFLDRGARAQAVYLAVKRGKMGLGAAREEFDRTVAACEEAEDLLGTTSLLTLLGDLYLNDGDLGEAVTLLERVITLREQGGQRLDYDVGAYPQLARARLVGLAGLPGRTDRTLVRKSLALTRRRHPNYRSLALLSQALLHWKSGKISAARQSFKAARTVARAQGAQIWLAEAYFEEGRCLVEAGIEADVGRKYLSQGLALFEACDARDGVGKVWRLMERF